MPRPITTFARSTLAAAALAAASACGGGDPLDPVTGQPLACLALPAEATLHEDTGLSSAWNDVLVDERQRIWLAGHDRAVLGESRLEPGGNARAVVRVLGSRGDLQFDIGERLDSPGADSAEALALGVDGRINIVGRTTGALAGSGNAGSFDVFVARGDAMLPTAPWRLAQLGDERPQHPRRVQAAGTALYVAGYDDDHIPTNHVQAWADGFVARLDLADAGAAAPVRLAWMQHRGLEPQDYTTAMAVHRGAVYSGGSVGAGAERGMFVQKRADDGRLLWTARLSSVGIDHVAAIVGAADGSVLVAGSVWGSFRGGVHQGQQDVFVARLRADDGAVLWSAQFGTSGSDWLADLEVDAEGRLVLFGETDGGFVDGRAGAGGSDLFLLRVAADGTLQQWRQWGRPGDETAMAVALDRCGRAVAVGRSAEGARERAVLWFPPAW